MFQPTPMRRRDRAVSREEAEDILFYGEWGVLATASGEGIPLATPLSYVFVDGCIYFHCAFTGQKMNNLAAQQQVCFCVVGRTRPVFEDGDFSTYYESAMAHGRAGLVQDPVEKQRALMELCDKYLPGNIGAAPEAINRSIDKTAVIRIDIVELTGKAKKAKPAPQPQPGQ